MQSKFDYVQLCSILDELLNVRNITLGCCHGYPSGITISSFGSGLLRPGRGKGMKTIGNMYGDHRNMHNYSVLEILKNVVLLLVQIYCFRHTAPAFLHYL